MKSSQNAFKSPITKLITAFWACALAFASSVSQDIMPDSPEVASKRHTVRITSIDRFRLFFSKTFNEDHPAQAVTAWKRGNDFCSQRKPVEAERSYRQALELDEKFGEAYTNLASLLWYLWRNREAEEMARHAVRLLPRVGVPYVLLGLAQFDNGKPNEAEKSMRQAIAIDEHPFAYYCLVSMLIEQQRIKDAKQISSKGLARWPDDPKLLATNAHLLLKEHRVDEAVAAAEIAVKLGPDLGITHKVLGFALDAAGRQEEALTEFLTWARLEPGSVDAQSWLGVVLYATGRYDEARKAAERAIKLRPDWASPYRLLGRILAEQSDHRGALGAFEKAIRLEPYLALTHLEASLAYSALGRRAEAEREYAEYLRLKKIETEKTVKK